ncbi:NeuD/PglB/VioB family sugar acetyltransferase [Flammeovirga kamogawensis]|uniref:Acetyltransferase n=1 Tax=Flammeovirga kamogawensis TaxID=373891 RepID=A0ABX8GSW3_9BACT|nr:NeuD/PglB/VioB family sugar acetyltransferase [Flammeovirga kamogawensis]MBB6463383.1 sugar O-acyltransferase (sialic acid O-acetyltransferase NeuD family) [Flammeovirga kamogawensis]QWG06646.1 acetyltransferase [Flammeovirga kamogawensis]TRX68469.1 acetyltransferase [Flammeovirga kamogawensis]
MEINPVIIFGASGLGKAALDIFKSQDILVFCFLDTNEELHGAEIGEVTVMGAPSNDGFLKHIGKKCDAFVAIEDQETRQKVTQMLKERRKSMPVNAIHKDASISPSAYLGYGNFINAGARIGYDAKVPESCVIHSNAVLEHNAELEDLVTVGSGAIIGTGAKIGKGALIGSGAIISSNVIVGEGAQVAPGSLVMTEVKANATVFGMPAQEI